MKSIRTRLTTGLLIGCLALLGTAGWVIYWLTQNALLAGFDARIRIEAMAIIQQTRQEPDKDKASGRDADVLFTDRYLPEFSPGGPEYYQVWLPGGKTEKRSDSMSGLPDLPRKTGTLDQPEFWTFRHAGKLVRAVGIRFVPSSWGRRQREHDPNFWLSLVVASELGSVGETLATLRHVLVAVGALVALAVILGVPWAVWRGFRPVERLSSDAARMDARHLSYRFPTEGVPSELLPIVTRLNALFGRLEESFERERRFSADAAHELRTPLAELRSLAEIALKWPPDPTETRRAFEDTLGIAEGLESLVAGLLAIARCESQREGFRREQVDLGALIASVWRRCEGEAERKRHRVELDLTEGIQVRGDSALLHTIFANLLANAVEYTPRFGSMRLQMETDRSEYLRVSMANTTHDLQPTDVPHLFERFWRKEQSRSSSSHSGLGLAVVKAAAGALGLGLRAEWIPPETLTISVDGFEMLPSAAGQESGEPTDAPVRKSG